VLITHPAGNGINSCGKIPDIQAMIDPTGFKFSVFTLNQFAIQVENLNGMASPKVPGPVSALEVTVMITAGEEPRAQKKNKQAVKGSFRKLYVFMVRNWVRSTISSLRIINKWFHFYSCRHSNPFLIF
jgi:hypothetical protein